MKISYKLSKKNLILLAGFVWMIAGFNVARLGILSYMAVACRWFYPLLSVATFAAFGTMFYKMSRKHIRRIKNYDEEFKPFWNFFDLKSYLIMAFMMSGGIWLRSIGLVPDAFIAFFYTGLGCALFLAGVLFVIARITYNKSMSSKDAKITCNNAMNGENERA